GRTLYRIGERGGLLQGLLGESFESGALRLADGLGTYMLAQRVASAGAERAFHTKGNMLTELIGTLSMFIVPTKFVPNAVAARITSAREARVNAVEQRFADAKRLDAKLAELDRKLDVVSNEMQLQEARFKQQNYWAASAELAGKESAVNANIEKARQDLAPE